MALLISVVIPTRNRLVSLKRLLAALAEQELAPDQFEVIVSDDGSTDGTGRFLETSAIRHVRKNCSEGPAAARNAGAARSQAPWLAFIDDDAIPSPGWLAAAARFIQGAAPETRAAEGDVLCPDPPLPLSHAVHHSGSNGWLSCNLLIEKRLFNEMEGFNSRFVYPMNDDFDFFIRLSGRTEITYMPGMAVVHPRVPLPFLETLRDAGDYANRRWFSERLLGDLHPGHYPQVKFAATARQTLGRLAFRYAASEIRKQGRALLRHPLRGLAWIAVCAARQAAFFKLYRREGA